MISARNLLRVVLLAVAIACGAQSSAGATTHPTLRAAIAACPGADHPYAVAADHGAMGVCAPRTVKVGANGKPPTVAAAQSFPDFSNNNPQSCAAFGRIKAAGHQLVYLKANQGTWVDPTFHYQALCARSHGLAVSGYDFVSSYSVREAQVFVSVLRAAGLGSRGPPATLDIEYANASRPGVQAMRNTVAAAFGHVQIYTGCWYWCSRLGAFWPSGTYGWLAGYPSAPILRGMPGVRYLSHQFSDRAPNGTGGTSDMSVYLPAHGKPSFATYIGKTAPKPVSEKTLRHRQLVHDYQRRKALRGVLAAHGCRVTHRRTRRCQAWLYRGNRVNRSIVALHRRDIF